jgi:hypothetical protein
MELPPEYTKSISKTLKSHLVSLLTTMEWNQKSTIEET